MKNLLKENFLTSLSIYINFMGMPENKIKILKQVKFTVQTSFLYIKKLNSKFQIIGEKLNFMC